MDKDFYVGYRFLEGEPEISEDSYQDYHLQPVSTVRDLSHIKTEPIQYDDNELVQKGWLEKYNGMEAGNAIFLLSPEERFVKYDDFVII